jgi:hypothetical protein
MNRGSKFEIQQVVNDGIRLHVIARLVTETDFAVSPGNSLGGCRVRALESRGSYGTCTFEMESMDDVLRIAVGSIVELAD